MQLGRYICAQHILRICALLFVLINTSFLIWYIFYGFQLFFHTDSAFKVLLAREILESGSYFPKDFNYVNGDLFVLFGHTFILPMLSVLPAGFTVHALAGLISSGLILLGTWLVSGLASVGVTQRLIVVAIIAGGFSGLTAEALYGQTAYGTIFYCACFILFLSWQYVISSGTKRYYLGSALAFLIVIVFWANPSRAVVYYLLPLLCSIVLHQWKVVTHETSNTPGSLTIFVPILFGLIIGTVLHLIVLAGVNNTAGAGHARWLPYSLMLENFSFISLQLLSVFGGRTSNGISVTSAVGLFEALRFLAVLGLVLLIIHSVQKAFRQASESRLFMVTFSIASFCPILFFQITTTIPDMNDPVTSSRYLIPPLMLLAVVALSCKIDARKEPVWCCLGLFVSAIYLLSAYPVYVKSNQSSQTLLLGNGSRENVNEVKRLANFLVKNELHFGYSTYWKAGVISVFTDEQALVRQVLFDRGLPVPMRHLASNRWYRPEAWEGETFLLLTRAESTAIDWDYLASFHGKPDRTLTFGEFIIYVYPKNLSKTLPGYDTSYQNPISFPASEFSYTQIGQLSEDTAGSGAILIAEAGTTGALHFGPYLTVDAGEYKVSFDVQSSYNPLGTIELDVVGLNQQVFAKETLLSSDGTQNLLINIESPQVLEFRVWALGTERVEFKKVSIVRTPPAVDE